MGNKEKIIVLMFDLQGTLDNMDSDNIKVLMKQIDHLRIKFGADKARIFVSSHVYSPIPLKDYLKIFYDNLLPNIILDDATYYFGTFNYSKDECEQIRFGYNSNKLKTFMMRYFDDYDIKWFAIIDDSLNANVINMFKNDRAMMICRPSQKREDDLQFDNIACCSTMTYGFDGVLECLDSYLKKIMDLDTDEIMVEQKRVLTFLNFGELMMLFEEKKYELFFEYLEKDLIPDSFYRKIGLEIWQTLENNHFDYTDLVNIKKIMDLVCIKLTNDNSVVNKYKNFISKYGRDSLTGIG